MSNEILLVLLQPDFDVSTSLTKQHVGKYNDDVSRVSCTMRVFAS